MNTRIRRNITIAMLSAFAYVIMVVGRIPMVLFLKYDPKDIVITIGGFMFGPLAALIMSVAVSFVEMITVSSTGPIGFVMNAISTCAFACLAAYIYKHNHTLKGAVVGLISGIFAMTGIMILWNYIITPMYMGISREQVSSMLLPIFLPFNLIKGGLNAAFTMLLYKPLSGILKKGSLTPDSAENKKTKINWGVVLSSLFILATCVICVWLLWH